MLLNPLNTKLNPICHLLALLGAHHILHISGIRVNVVIFNEAGIDVAVNRVEWIAVTESVMLVLVLLLLLMVVVVVVVVVMMMMMMMMMMIKCNGE
jgi:hypothetical protein